MADVTWVICPSVCLTVKTYHHDVTYSATVRLLWQMLHRMICLYRLHFYALLKPVDRMRDKLCRMTNSTVQLLGSIAETPANRK